jgi:hypothetical protein
MTTEELITTYGLPEGFVRLPWAEATNGQTVYIYGTHAGRPRPYGPHTVHNATARTLENRNGHRFMHYPEALLIEEGIHMTDERFQELLAEIPGNVDRGFNWLTPEQRAEIDPATVRVQSMYCCPLGQVFADFGAGYDRLKKAVGEADLPAYRHGFDWENSVSNMSQTQQNVYFDALNAEWRKRLT